MAAVEKGTAFAAIGKVAEVAPAGTVTDPGTDATALFELKSPTTAPPGGAGASRMTRLAIDVTLPSVVLGASEIASAPAVAAVVSTFCETYDDVHERAQGSSVKSVGIDCDQGAGFVCR